MTRLDYARANGTPGLESGRAALVAVLEERGLSPQELLFSCHAWRADWSAAAFVLGAGCMLWAALRRDRRSLAGCGLALVLAVAALAGGLDALQPATTQATLQAIVEPLSAPAREIVLGAHYDSKTEPLDHVGRSILFMAAAALAAGATAALLLRRDFGRQLGLGAALALLLVALQLVGGRWLGASSHGIVDDGAAAMLLAELAAETQGAPLQTTRVRFVWWSGEEVGAQGSAAFVGAQPTPSAPRVVVNLECLGAGPDLGIVAREWTGHRIVSADRGLSAALERAAPGPLHRLPYPSVTDAGPWLRHGVPAATLLGMAPGGGPPRHLHGAGDNLSRLDGRGVEVARQTLRRLLHDLDARPSPTSPPLGPLPASRVLE